MAVAIVSGGMDSTTLAYQLADDGHDLIVLSADYGQRHRRELEFAKDTADALDAEWHLVDLRSITELLASSALTNPDIDVPDGHYAEDTMRITVVPNRNAILLDIAVAVAVDRGARMVATAVHAGDHAVYPDCRPEFIEAHANMARIANEGFIHSGFGIAAPYLHKDKAYIAATGERLGVPWQLTWSCYKGGEVHCGACSTCFERREAFVLAGVDDPTEYLATPEYEAPRV